MANGFTAYPFAGVRADNDLADMIASGLAAEFICASTMREDNQNLPFSGAPEW